MPAWYYPDSQEELIVGETYILSYRSALVLERPFKCIVTRVRKRPLRVDIRYDGTTQVQTLNLKGTASPLHPCTETNLRAYTAHMETYQLLEALYHAGNLRMKLRDKSDNSTPITEPQRELLKALNQYFAAEPIKVESKEEL